MSGGKHTAGPWLVSSLTPALVVADCGDGMVMNVAIASQRADDLATRDLERQANAVLIAAAPDYAAAAAPLVHLVEFFGGDDSDEIAVTAGELRALAAAHARAVGAACKRCGGRGEVGGAVGQTPETFEWVTEPCPDCAKAPGEDA